ncbi:NUDIX domain-containing protein [Candidatus Pacearchaeota archaeon]|nr:NUDIX domain-containing protein [Candidatus Pacearchaeota archaeon]
MREDKINKIEVLVEAICFNEDRVFLLKRAPTRKLFPNIWECGGGAVEVGESFEEAAMRQLKEEAGIIIEPITAVKTFEISTPHSEQKVIPGIFFACKFVKYASGKSPRISNEHTEWRWEPISSVDQLESLPSTIKEAIKIGHEVYKKHSTRRTLSVA